MVAIFQNNGGEGNSSCRARQQGPYAVANQLVVAHEQKLRSRAGQTRKLALDAEGAVQFLEFEAGNVRR